MKKWLKNSYSACLICVWEIICENIENKFYNSEIVTVKKINKNNWEKSPSNKIAWTFSLIIIVVVVML